MPVKKPPKTVLEAVERYMLTAFAAAEKKIRLGEFNPLEFNALMVAAKPVLQALNKGDDGIGSNINDLQRALQDANSGRAARRGTLGRPFKGTVPGDTGDGSPGPRRGPGRPPKERGDAAENSFANRDPVADSERALSALAEPKRGNSVDVARPGHTGGDDPADDSGRDR